MTEQPRVELDLDELFGDANLTIQVHAAVRKAAQDLLNRAVRIDKRENRGLGVFTLRERYLPNGRFVTDVVSDDVEGEYGTSFTRRRRTLRRAVGGR